MKVKVIQDIKKNNDNKKFSLNDIVDNKIYEIISAENGWFRIVDESGEDYLYPSSIFEIVEQ